MTKSTTAPRAITAKTVPSHSVAGSSSSRAPGIPSGLSGGVSPCTGPGRKAKTSASTIATKRNVRRIHRPYRLGSPDGYVTTRVVTRATTGRNPQVATHAAGSPSGHEPGSVTRANLEYSPANRLRPTAGVIPHMTQPMRLAGRLETTRAPTSPNPTQVDSQIAPSSADSSACVVEMGGFTSLRTAARTINATPDSHMTHAIHRLVRELMSGP